jgi:hypothetical protein
MRYVVSMFAFSLANNSSLHLSLVNAIVVDEI